MITITHTHAEGTLCEGTAKGDGTAAILGASGRCRFKWSRNIGARGAWYVPNSRDRLADTYGINAKAEALRAAGYDVTVTIDETDRRSFAEAEAERYASAEARAERFAGYADNAAARANALHAEAERMAEAIPFGQPILVDHYSANRDRRYRARMVGKFERSFEESDKAQHYERRADNAERYQASRESVPVTLRRIAKLEAEQRDIERRLAGRQEYVSDGNGGHRLEIRKPEGDYLDRLTALAADYAEQLEYWRGVIAKAEESGVKVWSATDFAKGDYVLFIGTWYEVLRVNAKSVTIPGMIGAGRGPVCSRANCTVSWTDTVAYHKVKGRKSAAEIAELETATA